MTLLPDETVLAQARARSIEAFDGLLATLVRADEVVALDPEGTPVG